MNVYLSTTLQTQNSFAYLPHVPVSSSQLGLMQNGGFTQSSVLGWKQGSTSIIGTQNQASLKLLIENKNHGTEIGLCAGGGLFDAVETRGGTHLSLVHFIHSLQSTPTVYSNVLSGSLSDQVLERTAYAGLTCGYLKYFYKDSNQEAEVTVGEFPYDETIPGYSDLGVLGGEATRNFTTISFPSLHFRYARSALLNGFLSNMDIGVALTSSFGDSNYRVGPWNLLLHSAFIFSLPGMKDSKWFPTLKISPFGNITQGAGPESQTAGHAYSLGLTTLLKNEYLALAFGWSQVEGKTGSQVPLFGSREALTGSLQISPLSWLSVLLGVSKIEGKNPTFDFENLSSQKSTSSEIDLFLGVSGSLTEVGPVWLRQLNPNVGIAYRLIKGSYSGLSSVPEVSNQQNLHSLIFTLGINWEKTVELKKKTAADPEPTEKTENFQLRNPSSSLSRRKSGKNRSFKKR